MFDDLTIRIIIQLVLATLLGLAVGLERERHRKAAGMRTYALVCLGSALFTILSLDGMRALEPSGAYDASRIAANIVMGIGFIGAGLIFLQGNMVRGLTTAAAIWATAAIGMAVGMQMYTVAIISTALVLLTILLFRPIEALVPRVDDAEDADKL